MDNKDLISLLNTMVANVPVTQGARASVAMVLTQFYKAWVAKKFPG